MTHTDTCVPSAERPAVVRVRQHAGFLETPIQLWRLWRSSEEPRSLDLRCVNDMAAKPKEVAHRAKRPDWDPPEYWWR